MSELDALMNHPRLQQLIADGVLPHDFRKLSAEAAVAWLDAAGEDLDAKMARDQATLKMIEAEMERRRLKPRGKR